jgi:predicted neuraminidase
MLSEFVSDEWSTGLSCHASTVAHLSAGRVAAAWFSGTAEKAPDVCIRMAVRSNMSPSGSWCEPWVAAKVPSRRGETVAHWNPVLHVAQGRVTLYFKVGVSVAGWRQWQTSAQDGADVDLTDPAVWSAPRETVPGPEGCGGRGAVRTKQLVVGSGVLLAGGSTELTDAALVQRLAEARAGPHSSALEVGWRSFIDVSVDGGSSWKRTPYLHVHDQHRLPSRNEETHAGGQGPLQQVGIIQPALWSSSPTAVHALIRSDGGALYRADSDSGGLSWSAARRTVLPNNNSGIDVARLASGLLVLIHNPVGGNWGKRCPLRVSLSDDNGATFPRGFDLETQLLPGSVGEFSYPGEFVVVCNTTLMLRQETAFPSSCGVCRMNNVCAWIIHEFVCLAAVVAWPDGDGVSIVYTWHRRRIKAVLLSEIEVLRRLDASQLIAKI